MIPAIYPMIPIRARERFKETRILGPRRKFVVPCLFYVRNMFWAMGDRKYAVYIEAAPMEGAANVKTRRSDGQGS
jgi:hypothetical protein